MIQDSTRNSFLMEFFLHLFVFVYVYLNTNCISAIIWQIMICPSYASLLSPGVPSTDDAIQKGAEEKTRAAEA